MSKSTLEIAIALSSCAATHAANQGQSVVNFRGTVVDIPCGIDPDSADQTTDFGQIPKSHSENDGISVKKDLDIKLADCDFTDSTVKKTVSVTFSGTPVNGHTDEPDTAGDTGTAVVVSASDGSMVKFDGTTSSNATQLQDGDNTLEYTTWVRESSAAGTEVKEGDFTAVANFSLGYQ